jgi:signal transduction histidine kinase
VLPRYSITAFIAAAAAMLLIIAAYNLFQWRTCDFVRWQHGAAMITDPTATAADSAHRAMVPIGKINGIPVLTRTEFVWAMTQLRPGTANTYATAADPTVKHSFAASIPRSPWTILVILFVGIVFCGLGLFIWTKAERNPVAGAFLRINLATGIAILLDDHPNIYTQPILHSAYALVWIFSYMLIPAMFVEFTWRFSQESGLLRRTRAWFIYVPISILAIVTAAAYLGAWQSADALWIRLHAGLWQYGFGIAVACYFSVGMFSLIRMGRPQVEPTLRRRNRWLILTTITGIAPYALFHRLPPIWGGEPKIPMTIALLFLLITPLGWGMATASFRMLKTDLSLSRAMTYTTASIIGIILVFTTVIWATWRAADASLRYVPFILILGSILTVLAIITVYKGVNKIVDRMYFGDYFDFRREVQRLATELSAHYSESSLRTVLTQKLPALLQTPSAILLRLSPRASTDEALWLHVSALVGAAADDDVLVPVPSHHELALHDAAYVLRLRHGGSEQGYLLLKRKQVGMPFSARDLELIRSLSPVAGIALANLTLIENTIAQERRLMAAEFAGGVAHEINNALSPLRGQAQLLLRATQSDPENAMTQRIEHSTQIIVDMTGKIQRIADNLTRLAEPLKLATTRIKLEDVIRDALRILGETAGRIKRFSSTDPDAPFRLIEDYDLRAPVLQGDADQLCQALMNLILNACDAMEQKGAGTLVVGTRHDSARHEIAAYVSDTGPGIPLEYRDRIFEPYFTTKAGGKGTGLGLSIVRLIAEAHGGTVQFSTDEERGTTFEIVLPELPV